MSEPIKVFVTGLESSGTQWVSSMLSQHPGLIVQHGSCPSDGGPYRHYVQLPKDHVVVIVVRDKSCQEASVKRRGYNDTTPDKFSFEENIGCLSIYIDAAPKTVFVSYETLVMWKQKYLNQVFHQLGVESITVTTEWRDENSKYRVQ